MTTGMYVYFENYGRYDWTRYFYGHSGLDLRWTPAKRRMWSARFGAMGVRKQMIRVLVEEGPLRGTGEDEWEEHLTAALGNHSLRWLQLDGQATTFNWARVLRPALPRARAARLRAAPQWPPPLPVARTDPNAEKVFSCINCAIWANFRPRRKLRGALRGSPVGLGEPLACLKGRTMCAVARQTPPACDARSARHGIRVCARAHAHLPTCRACVCVCVCVRPHAASLRAAAPRSPRLLLHGCAGTPRTSASSPTSYLGRSTPSTSCGSATPTKTSWAT